MKLLEGFYPWPFLQFSPSILNDIGLRSQDTTQCPTIFQIYDKIDQSWSNIKEGY